MSSSLAHWSNNLIPMGGPGNTVASSIPMPIPIPIGSKGQNQFFVGANEMAVNDARDHYLQLQSTNMTKNTMANDNNNNERADYSVQQISDASDNSSSSMGCAYNTTAIRPTFVSAQYPVPSSLASNNSADNDVPNGEAPRDESLKYDSSSERKELEEQDSPFKGSNVVDSSPSANANQSTNESNDGKYALMVDPMFNEQLKYMTLLLQEVTMYLDGREKDEAAKGEGSDKQDGSSNGNSNEESDEKSKRTLPPLNFEYLMNMKKTIFDSFCNFKENVKFIIQSLSFKKTDSKNSASDPSGYDGAVDAETEEYMKLMTMYEKNSFAVIQMIDNAINNGMMNSNSSCNRDYESNNGSSCPQVNSDGNVKSPQEEVKSSNASSKPSENFQAPASAREPDSSFNSSMADYYNNAMNNSNNKLSIQNLSSSIEQINNNANNSNGSNFFYYPGPGMMIPNNAGLYQSPISAFNNFPGQLLSNIGTVGKGGIPTSTCAESGSINALANNSAQQLQQSHINLTQQQPQFYPSYLFENGAPNFSNFNNNFMNNANNNINYINEMVQPNLFIPSSTSQMLYNQNAAAAASISAAVAAAAAHSHPLFPNNSSPNCFMYNNGMAAGGGGYMGSSVGATSSSELEQIIKTMNMIQQGENGGMVNGPMLTHGQNHQLQQLHQHLLNNSKSSLICPFCSCSLSSKSMYQAHLRTHNYDRRPYRCSFAGCNQGFAKRAYLIVHERTHTGDRPYHCKFCSRKFTQKSALNSHCRAVHSTSTNNANNASNNNPEANGSGNENCAASVTTEATSVGSSSNVAEERE